MEKIEIGKWELGPEIVVRTSMGSPTVYIRNWDGEHYSICEPDSEQAKNSPKWMIPEAKKLQEMINETLYPEIS